METEFKAREEVWAAERARLQAEVAEQARAREAERLRMEQMMMYVTSLGQLMGHTPPAFSPLPPLPVVSPAVTPVSDLQPGFQSCY